MQGAFEIIGWVLWVVVLLWGLATVGSRNSDGGVRQMTRTQGLVLLIFCVVTALFPISKYWLLAAIPVAFYLPMVLMKRRAIGIQQRFEELLKESDRSGVPLGDLLERETRRLGGEERRESIDYYDDLTDEERSEEGLPPRKPAKEDKRAADAKPEPDEEEDHEEGDAEQERISREIAEVGEYLINSLGKYPLLAERHRRVEKRLRAASLRVIEAMRRAKEDLTGAEGPPWYSPAKTAEAAMFQERAVRQLARDNADFAAIQKSYVIAGMRMTEAHREQVEDYILKNPEVGSRLTIEQLTRIVFPDAMEVGPKSPPTQGE